MGLKIDILCTDGSPLGVIPEDIYGTYEEHRIGVGGSELALLTLFEAWKQAGHTVRLFNSPHRRVPDQYPTGAFQSQDDRDVLITFRTPNAASVVAKGYRVWWSCDQFTTGNYRDFAGHNNKIVTISPFHKQYFEQRYEIRNADVIDLPVRDFDYEQEYERIPYRFIFTSVPDRGLEHLFGLWPRIKDRIPQASLVITSDYRLWGWPVPRNEVHKIRWLGKEGVSFVGAVKRQELIRHQLQADMMIYPCTYDELFCIACAESQFAGSYSVTSAYGALPSTNMGSVVHGVPNDPHWQEIFLNEVFDLIEDRDSFESTRFELMNRAYDRFNIQRILEQWDEKVFRYV